MYTQLRGSCSAKTTDTCVGTSKRRNSQRNTEVLPRKTCLCGRRSLCRRRRGSRPWQSCACGPEGPRRGGTLLLCLTRSGPIHASVNTQRCDKPGDALHTRLKVAPPTVKGRIHSQLPHDQDA